MESQHTLSNPWSFNQTQGRDSDDDLQHTFIKDLRFGRRRDSGDHRHYSYASSTTIAPEPFEDDSDSLFSSSPQKQSIDPDLVKRSASPIAEPEAVVASSEVEVEAEGGSHSRTWSSESDIVGSALVEAVHVNDHIQSLDNLFNSTLDRDQAPSISSMADSTALTITKMRGNDSDPSAKTLSDSGVGLEGDVLEHLVQRLQSEVADTRAIVFDLESRLNAAENSNKHIVDELKVLLADAEGTLIGSDESDSGESVAVSSKHGSGTDEDSNVVYNRICSALQSLITDAQSALVRTSTPTTSNVSSTSLPAMLGRRSCRHSSQSCLSQGQRPLSLPGTSTAHSLYMDDGESSQYEVCSHSSCRTSRRSSITHSRSDKPFFNPTNSSSSRLQAQSGRKAFSRVLWKEKQLEQYERYRRSCDIVSLELEMLLNDTMLGQQDLWDEDLSFMPGSTPAALSDNVSNAPSMSPQSASSLGQEAPLTSMPSAPRKERMPRTPGSKAERLQRSYQALLLSPQVRARQLQRQRLQHNDDQDHTFQPILHEQHQSLISFPSPSHSTRKRPHRQYKSTGVGASRPHSILVQLYGLWKQTWLRQRIMHVLTESLELMLILWVVLKLTEVSLSWMGIRMLKSPNSSGDSINNSASGRVPWLTYFYGDREGAGSAAKELYARIRRDGLRLREMRIWRQREREQLMREMVASEKAMGMQRTPFTPAAMVWAPAGRLLAQAVSGLTLAYLSDYAKQLIKKL